ncbi:trimeric intracellular cation channel family protein [Pseudonocardia benzenivorans]|uniref:Trimeric intracellular cation channel family protein n=1 Tax=Pseudonocardia benzenivorans TaxID=228005 RepID=A0ABW3VSM4_9PSEU
MRVRPAGMLTTADLAATMLFAVEGGAQAAAAGLDLFGVLVVAFATAVGGGILRDLLLGDVPPAALRSVAYPAAIATGATIVVVLYAGVRAVPAPVLVTLDAAGLALFCVVGATKALDFRVGGVLAVLLGTITGVGGGVLRDLLLREVPTVLRTDIYALAAALGAFVVVVARRSGMPRAAAMVVGAAACLALRLVSAAFGWHLPQVVA